MSEYLDYVKDPNIKQYLEHLRKQNKSYMSICKYCKDKAIGVIAEGYLLYPACKVHMVIFDTLARNKELLDRLGSDYDENGIPYWEK